MRIAVRRDIRDDPRMTRPANTRKPSSKARRKKRRATLTLASNGLGPTIIGAQTDGVEAQALTLAQARGLAYAGFVPSRTRNPGDSFLATPTTHPSQALKWNARFADASVLITPSGPLFGRALLARLWCERYRKPWLHLHPGNLDSAAVRQWLKTRPIKSLHIAGARAHQADGLESVLDLLFACLDPASTRLAPR